MCYCASIGDSRSIIARKLADNWIPVQMSTDHKPENKEAERILAAGGRITPHRD